MTDEIRAWRERRLYVFTCNGCGKPKRRTVKKKRARSAICASCAHQAKKNENQLTLFSEPKPQPTPTT